MSTPIKKVAESSDEEDVRIEFEKSNLVSAASKTKKVLPQQKASDEDEEGDEDEDDNGSSGTEVSKSISISSSQFVEVETVRKHIKDAKDILAAFDKEGLGNIVDVDFLMLNDNHFHDKYTNLEQLINIFKVKLNKERNNSRTVSLIEMKSDNTTLKQITDEFYTLAHLVDRYETSLVPRSSSPKYSSSGGFRPMTMGAKKPIFSTVTTLKEVKMLQPNINSSALQKFEDEFNTAREQNGNLNYVHYFQNETKTTIQSMLLKNGVITTDNDDWKMFSLEKLCTELRKIIEPKDQSNVNLSNSLLEDLANMLFEFPQLNLWGTLSISAIMQVVNSTTYRILRKNKVLDIDKHDDHNNIDNITKKNVMRVLMKAFLENSSSCGKEFGVYAKTIVDALKLKPEIMTGTSVFKFMSLLEEEIEKHHDTIVFVSKNLPALVAAASGTKRSLTLAETSVNPLGRRSTSTVTTLHQKPKCEGCGKGHVNRYPCFMREHPDFNRSQLPWSETVVGKKYLLFQPTDPVIGYRKKLNPAKTAMVDFSYSKPAADAAAVKNFKSKCTICTVLTFNKNSNNRFLSACFIQNNANRLQVRVLMDSGADSGSYINSEVATWLVNHGNKYEFNHKVVCSCFGDCKSVNNCITSTLNFDNVINFDKKICKISLQFWVIDNLPHEVVIGNKDIESNKELYNIFHHKKRDVTETSVENKNSHKLARTSTSNSSCTNLSITNQGPLDVPILVENKKVTKESEKLSLDDVNSFKPTEEDSTLSQNGVQPKPDIPVGKIVHISELLSFEPDAYGIPDKWDSIDEYLNAERLLTINPETKSQLPVGIFGPASLQTEIKKLLEEFSDIFSVTVASTPAKLPPFRIKVDDKKWHTLRGNINVPPRTQSHDKNNEIQRQCEKLVELNVLEFSSAPRYSQVHLVKKAQQGTFRMCIDYVLLNTCCEGESWNLPNIREMLDRLGRHRSKYYAIMDLTSGYHQAPLHEESKKYTSFITFMGLFQWNRVPMGAKGAASYFQMVLQTIVLAGLMYVACELYIDDIITHGQDEVQFITNLRRVFVRLRKYKITLNPEKCKFGVSSVEYVGHVIDETGIHFSRKKIEEVLAIPRPTLAKELRSFLGLVSYLRDHLQGLSTILRPLQDMLTEYDKNRKLTWSPQGTEAFEVVKKLVNECPKLFFLNKNDPVFLNTDASDYGIGAYLYQLIDGKEVPIRFMSKTLSSTEMKWSTIEKECYAIRYAIEDMEYLLSDIRFTLRTDHENLTYINDPPSPKVRRWKIVIQGFDFVIEHIRGVDNVVADGLSRLLPVTKDILMLAHDESIPNDKYNLIRKVHNTHVGHHGVDRTEAMLEYNGSKWEGRRKHITTFIKKCACCQKMNMRKITVFTHPFTLATHRPMEFVHIDTLYMSIENEEGDLYVLVIIDSCSRWIKLYGLKNLEAVKAAQKILQYVCTFGHPSFLLSDNGRQFKNDLLDELFKLTGIEPSVSTPHSHEENGLVERANKEVLRHVRSILFDRGVHKNWGAALPLVERIHNSAISTVTGCTPAQLVLTNPKNLEQGLFKPISSTAKANETIPEWLHNQLELYQKVLDVSQTKLREMEREKLEKAPLSRTEHKDDSYVLLRPMEESLVKGQFGKLKLPLKGPMMVKSHKKDKYTIQDITTGKTQPVHIKRLVPFYYDASIHDLKEIALKDLDEEVVERILDHNPKEIFTKEGKRIKGFRVTDLDFLVEFKGQDTSNNHWLPWTNLFNNIHLHSYLKDNGMKSLIPIQFTKDNKEKK